MLNMIVPSGYRQLLLSGVCLFLIHVVTANDNATVATWTWSAGTPFMGGMTTFELPDGDEFCFYQEFKDTLGKWIVAFRVVRGGNNDVNVEVKNMGTKAVLYQENKKHFDHKEIDFNKGLYSICFSNKFSTFAHKYVFFYLEPVHPESLEVEAGDKPVPKAKTLMESIIGDIHEHLTDVSEHQAEHKAQVYEGIWVAFDLNKNVNVMSIIVSISILIIGFGQVYLLRRLFDTPKGSTIKPATNVFVSPM